MDAVWLVRSRQMAARFRFWLAMFGYNPRDRSISHKIYLVYAAIFYMLWGFMVLTLQADWMGQFLTATGIIPIPNAALSIALAGLLAWTLLAALSASRRSPILFTEEDAYLICQTPADRRAVALAWLIGQWILPALIAGVIAVTLGFGVVEASSPSGLTTADLPRYILAGFRIVFLVLPVHLGLNALVWALGVYRLAGARRIPRLYWLPMALIALALIGLLTSSSTDGTGVTSLLAAFAQPPWITVLWPLSRPLQAGFGQFAWTSGLLPAWMVTAVGLGLLAWLAGNLNLSRAAMESRYMSGQAFRHQTTHLRPDATSRQFQQIGVGRPAGRMPRREGWWALIWKDLIQSSRLGRLRLLLYGLVILLFGLGIVLVNDWGVRAWLGLLWVIFIGQVATRQLRADLALWGIYRSLPLASRRLVLGDVVSSSALISLISWVGLLIGILMGADQGFTVLIGLFIPFLAVNVVLAAAVDCLRLGTTASLLAGDVPQPGILGALLGIGVITMVAALIWWAQIFGVILAIWVTLLVAALLLSAAGSQLQRMK